ncbi:hypothetical protein [Streptomyces sp. SGAir0957]
MRIWPGWNLTVKIARATPLRCLHVTTSADGLWRCIFIANHPPHGHTLSRDLTAPAVPSPGMLADRGR